MKLIRFAAPVLNKIVALVKVSKISKLFFTPLTLVLIVAMLVLIAPVFDKAF